MKKCVVIGGGFAGLSAAAFLLSSGIYAEIIESSPKLGGRAYSLNDEQNSSIIDNGQHIMMGCYNNTIDFLKLTGADKNFLFQEKLKVNFLKKGSDVIKLEAGNGIYPFNLASGLMKFEALSLNDRLYLLKLFLKIPLIPEKDLTRMTVREWLITENQNENIRKSFWNILAIGALNTSTEKASASIFLRMLKQIFFTGSKGAVIVLPAAGLTEAYCNDTAAWIENKGGVINTGEAVQEFKFNGQKITQVVTSKRVIKDFDCVISAVPHYALNRFFPEIYPDLEFEYSPILSFHLWLRNNPLEKDFFGLIDSPLHWIFNHGSHLTLVISNAGDLISKSKEELFLMMIKELHDYTGIKQEEIIRYQVIKEKRATFVPSINSEKMRPPVQTSYSNFFLAGDWINTGLPSTIESAVKSGRMAVDAILNKN